MGLIAAFGGRLKTVCTARAALRNRCAALALRWLMQQEPVDSIILGASSMAHLEANVAAAQSDDLSGETMAECDQVWQRLRGCPPFYNR